MKSIVAAFLFLSLFSSFSVYALEVHYGVEIHQSGEYTQVTKKDLEDAGCQGVQDPEETGEIVCKVAGVVSEHDLPFSLEIGEAYFSISKEGQVNLGLSYGDADGGADGTLTLPSDENGNLLPVFPLKLNVNGGDNASGTWSFDGTVQLSVE